MKWLLFILVVVAGILLGKYLYFKPRFVHGEKAPDFSVELIDGSAFQLSDLRGKYVLLDFWGSWCAPCREENPELVRLYRQFGREKFSDAAGFEIVSIGMEAREESWKRAIAMDGLEWPYHYADFKRMKTDVGVLYGVKEIPTKYLINPKGYIMGVNQTIDEIEIILEDALE